MRQLVFRVPEEYAGKKLKNFLKESCMISSGILTKMKWIYDGITVNGKHAYVTEILKTDDIVCLKIPCADTMVTPQQLPLDILYEDEDILIVNKAPFMPIYPTPGHDKDSLANAVSFHAHEKGEKLSFHPIFRLDKNTSGIVMLAKNSYAASLLAFGVHKTYQAICEGMLEGFGTINAPIQLKTGHGIQREVGDGPQAQSAITHWSVIAPGKKGHTLLQIQLETGRTHQIRVHFSSIGHPLAGDDMYGGSKAYINRQALHCNFVRFTHPVTREIMEFTQDLPEDMIALI